MYEIPDFQSLMLPLLKCAATKTTEVSVRELADEIANDLKLPPEALTATYASGSTKIFVDRLHWAKTYLVRAGVLETTRRAYFRATDRGRALLAEGLLRIDNKTLSRYAEFSFPKREASLAAVLAPENLDEKASPEDEIASGYSKINAALSQDLLTRLRNSPPAFFEQVVIDLLVAMNFGGGNPEAGLRLGRSGDGGIDGLISEDALGLDVVYVQAKRYAEKNIVPVNALREFVGSLEAKRATKGVFVTSSSLPASAHQLVKDVGKRIKLIDGVELASLMIKYGVGVTVKRTIAIRALDEDYFPDDKSNT